MSASNRLPPIIGVCGAIGSGKDTFAAAVALLRPVYRPAKFAAALRDVVAQLTAVPADRMLDTAGKSAAVVLPDSATLLARATALTLPPQTTAADLVAFLEALPASTTVGRLLQTLGTDFFRRRDPDFWVRALFDRWDHNPEPTVVSDVRFPNEAAAIRARGGVIVEIRSHTRHPATVAGRDPLHESERGVAADFVLDNNGTIDKLQAATEQLLQQLVQK
jgi:hypothetical protein